MLFTRIDDDGTRLIQPGVDKGPAPVACITEAHHVDAVLASVSPVQVAMDPVIRQTVWCMDVLRHEDLVLACHAIYIKCNPNTNISRDKKINKNMQKKFCTKSLHNNLIKFTNLFTY